MRIAIIGGGLTGLTASYILGKSKEHEITIFEQQSTLGGLAHGFCASNWKWHLEAYYHHLFTNDTDILSLMKDLDLSDSILRYRPVTSTFSASISSDSPQIFQLDSPLSLLRFTPLPFSDRIRTGILLGFLKANPFWKPLEHITAKSFIQKIGGSTGWKHIWEPLFKSKFGSYEDRVNAAWFWARIKKRTPELIYIKGGFQTLISTLEQKMRESGSKIYINTPVQSIAVKNSTFEILPRLQADRHLKFDTVLITTPSHTVPKLFPNLPKQYINNLLSIPHLSAQTLIIESTKPILNTHYWLNITDTRFPFLAVVAHTNMVDQSHYDNHHISYIGNYLPVNHRYISFSKEQLFQEFFPWIQKINPEFSASSVVKLYSFVGPHAQPVHTINYSNLAPKFETPIPNVYLANMDSIYPWDRGTNYAVELGVKVSKLIK